MSRYEWENGTIKLPSAEFASFRQAMQDVDRVRKDKAFAITQDFWKGLTRKQQTDPAAYQQALNAHQAKRYAARQSSTTGYGGYGWNQNFRQPDPVEEAARELADDLLARKADAYKMIDGRWQHDPDHKPSRVLASDMNYPTNRSLSFRDGDAHVRFDKDAKSVTWSVEENNHAVESARATPLARAFFERLGKVRWTHGTGGVILGNDEYNKDAGRGFDGGGGTYVTDAHGYLGITEAPGHVRAFINAKGERIEPTVTRTRSGGLVGKAVKAGAGQGRVARGVPTGGQFATRARGESGVRL